MAQQQQVLQCCRLCKSSKIKAIFKKEDIFIFKCLDCKVIFLGNELDDFSIKELYKYYCSSQKSYNLSPITKLRYEKLLDTFEKYRKNNNIMDVGCGAGHFLLSASNRHWNSEGTEISDEAIKVASEKKQSVFKGDISFLKLKGNNYDVVTLFEVLEHAPDPEGIIRKIEFILRPGGLCYITTPNFNGIARYLLKAKWGMFHREHFFYFKPKDLVRILLKYNFKVKGIKTENIFLAEIMKLLKKQKVPIDKKHVIFQRQEYVRKLAEEKPFFSALKKFINFFLNALKIGDTIYIFAEKRPI